MTCIAGIVEEGKIYMGADSCVTIGNIIAIKRYPKIWQKSNMLFGTSGSCRTTDLLKFSLTIPKHPSDIDDITYITTLLLNDVQKCLIDGIESSTTTNGVAETNNSVALVGYNGNLYEIDPDYSIMTVKDNYMAIGCGKDLALGSLHTSTGNRNPLERLKMALEAAAYNSWGVEPPFDYLTL